MAKSEDKTEQKTTKAAPRKTASAKSASAKSAGAKKPAAAKSASKAAASETGAAKSSASLKSAAPQTSPRALSDEERYKMTEVAAYFLAERNNFSGNPVEYWRAAEVQISNMLSMK